MNVMCAKSVTMEVGFNVKLEQEPDIDSTLVLRVQKGDLSAFQSLVERYQNRAHTIAYGMVRNYQDAEDIVQEAFVKAYRNINLFRGDSSFYTWLYRIIYNLTIDLSRKRYKQLETNVSEVSVFENAARNSLASPLRPDELLSQNELRKELIKALDNLSPEHKSVIVLREIEGLSYEEISKVIKCSKGTVMSRLHHARKKLQNVLSAYISNQKEKQSV